MANEDSPPGPPTLHTRRAQRRVAGSVACSWLLLAAPLVVLYAHARGLRATWSGDAWFGCSLAADRCDLLFTLDLARDVLDRLAGAWQSGGPLGLLGGFWRIPVESRALNVLDLLFLLSPLRAALPLGPALVVLHLVLLVLAMVGGYALARGLGASPLAALAGAGVAGTSGALLSCLTHAQYAQALPATCFLYFYGLSRLWTGRRGGVALTVAGAVLSLLLYWLNGVILGLGTLAWVVGAWAGAWPRGAGLLRDIAVAVGASAVLLLPAAIPVVGAMGVDTKLALAAPALSSGIDFHLLLAELDAVPVRDALSPLAGWLVPGLPFTVFAALALPDRRNLPWVLLVVLAAALLPGPFYVTGDEGGAGLLNATDPASWVHNPLYLAFHRIPLASRMYHPLRWGVLSSAGLVVLVATGAEKLRTRAPRASAFLVVAGFGWAVWAGPWPLKTAPLPGVAERTLRGCTEVVTAPVRGTRPSRLGLLAGVADVPFYPIFFDPDQGASPPTADRVARSFFLMEALDAVLTSNPGEEPLPTGTCVLLDPDASRLPVAHERLERRYGTPARFVMPVAAWPELDHPLDLEVFRVP